MLPYSPSGLVAGDVVAAATRTGYTVSLSYTSNVTLQVSSKVRLCPSLYRKGGERGSRTASGACLCVYAPRFHHHLHRTVHHIVLLYICVTHGQNLSNVRGTNHTYLAGCVHLQCRKYGNHYNNVFLVPRGPTTPLASNADGFHSSGMRHGPTLSNVSMLNLLDDYFNVHNTFQIVAKRAGPRSVLVGDYQYLAGDNTLYVLALPECNHTRRPAHHPSTSRPLSLPCLQASLFFFGEGLLLFVQMWLAVGVRLSHASICEQIRSIQ